MEDSREPLHVLHVGKTGGTALNHVLVEHAGVTRYRLVFGGHQLTVADFKTPNELATALSADDSSLRKQAEAAMQGIGHLNTGYSYWFGDESSFRARVPDLFFIGFQERLDEDFETLKQRLGIPVGAELPRGDLAHEAPAELDTQLGEAARANLARWYAEDLAFVQRCRELAPRINTVKP